MGAPQTQRRTHKPTALLHQACSHSRPLLNRLKSLLPFAGGRSCWASCFAPGEDQASSTTWPSLASSACFSVRTADAAGSPSPQQKLSHTKLSASQASISDSMATTPRTTAAGDALLETTTCIQRSPTASLAPVPAERDSMPAISSAAPSTHSPDLQPSSITYLPTIPDSHALTHDASPAPLILAPPLILAASAPSPVPVDLSVLTLAPRGEPASHNTPSSCSEPQPIPYKPISALPLSSSLSAPGPLSMPTTLVSPSAPRVLACGSTEDLGDRRCMEDTSIMGSLDEHDALPRLMGVTGPMLIAGVFDGHNGDAASNYLREHSMRLLCESAQHLGSSGVPAAPAAVLRDALAVAERELVAEGCAGPVAGTTALLVLAAPEQQKLWTANVGDCRLALSTMGPSGFASTSVATVDHRPADNPAERDRLANAGVPVDSSGYISHPAVAAGTGNDMGCTEPLQLSRSLGDRQFKTAVGCTLLSTPDIAEHELGGDVQFLVLATDGVWDKLRPNEACKVVRQALEGRTGAEDDAARALVQAVRKQPGPDDNAAVIVVRLADITKRVSRFNRGPAA